MLKASLISHLLTAALIIGGTTDVNAFAASATASSVNEKRDNANPPDSTRHDYKV
jgi:hypothetical protein